jgi:hypothetical protein
METVEEVDRTGATPQLKVADKEGKQKFGLEPLLNRAKPLCVLL